MASSFNLSRTNDLHKFVEQNSGDGTVYAKPSEFILDLLRTNKNRQQHATRFSQVIKMRFPGEPSSSKEIF